jgi:hypothetical protein
MKKDCLNFRCNVTTNIGPDTVLHPAFRVSLYSRFDLADIKMVLRQSFS